MDQEKIKSWWFNMVSELVGQNMGLSAELDKLRSEIKRLENSRANEVPRKEGAHDHKNM